MFCYFFVYKGKVSHEKSVPPNDVLLTKTHTHIHIHTHAYHAYVKNEQ